MMAWLRPHFRVRSISLGPSSETNTPLPLSFRGRVLGRLPRAINLVLRRYEKRCWTSGLSLLAKNAARTEPHFISVHDLDLLPLALAIRDLAGRHCRVLFDAREYYPSNFEDRPLWRLFFAPYNRYLARTYLGQADHVVTVSPGIATEYQRMFGVHCGVLPSFPEPLPLGPTPARDEVVRMVHHGFASRSRRIEKMIELVRLLPPRFSLDLLLVGSDVAYIHHLRTLAAPLASRVRFLAPRPFSDLVRFTNQYDVGLFLCEPSNFNLRHCLPNKFFEFVQARLAVAIGPSPEMASIVRRYGFGVISETFEPNSLATVLAPLSAAQLSGMKAASHRAAAELNSAVLRPKVEAIALGQAGVEVLC